MHRRPHTTEALRLTVSIVLIFLETAAFAQMNTGQVAGKVKDPNGGVIQNASVTATEQTTGRKFSSITNDSGQYLVAQLPVGEYKLEVSAPGFKNVLRPDLLVHAGDELRQNFSLELGNHSEIIEVSASPSDLQVESAAIQNTIDKRKVESLPLKDRQFIAVVGLSAGITTAPSGTRGAALQQTGTTWGVLGQRGGHNLYLVDGSNVTDEYYNNLVINPSVDAIEEVKVGETSYNAEFGGKSGSVINVISKSGNNQFHGSGFEFLRNEAFDAKNYFDSPALPIPPYKQNQFGGTIGGPIQKNRTFFFLSYEHQITNRGLTGLFTVPTEAERSGNFSGTGITLINPKTGTPFANDTIPMVDPVAAAILAKVPLPNVQGLSNNLLASRLSTLRISQYDTRLDHSFSATDSAYLRFSLFDAREFDPFGSGALNESLLPGFGYNLGTHTDNASTAWTHILSPSWLNELRFGWLRVGGGQTSANVGNNFSSITGLQGVTSNPLDTGYPQAVIAGLTTMGEPTQYVSRRDTNYEIYDNVIWQHATHVVKFGIYFFHLDFDPVNANNARGLFQFTGHYSGNPLGDFLLGVPALGQVGLGGRGTLNGRTHWLHSYVEDEYQIRPNLKFDIGLRYEYNQNVTDVNNNMSVVNTSIPGGEFVIASNGQNQISSAAAPLLSAIPIPYVTSAQAGWERSLLTERPLRFAPRTGIAWSLPDQKTVIRSGFGVYTNQAAYSIIQNAALNLPFYFAKTVTNSTPGASAFSTENILTAPMSGSISANNLDHNYKIEYNEVWNLAVQRSLADKTTFQAEYVGSKTVHADNESLENLFPGGLPSSSPLHVRPIPQMSGFTTIVWNGWEKYNALNLTFSHRTANGLVLDANYTWSKALDDASNPGPNNAGTNLPQDPNNLAAEEGLSDFDHRQRLVIDFLYALPSPTSSIGWLRTALSDWHIGGIWTIQSGSPFTVNLSNDNANNGTPVASQRPDLICNPNNGPQTVAEWFNTSCFVNPPALVYGNAGRDIVIGPGLNDFDASVQRQVRIHERSALQFRADAFDVFNHPNLNQPNRTFTPVKSNFGTISSAQDPRVMQLSVRLSF